MKISKGHTVIAILESINGEEEVVKNALMQVAASCRAEISCLEYRLHQNKTNPAQFVLYENWESSDLHQEQFKKSYIIDFGKKIKPLLAKPYQVIFANELV